MLVYYVGASEGRFIRRRIPFDSAIVLRAWRLVRRRGLGRQRWRKDIFGWLVELVIGEVGIKVRCMGGWL